MSHQTYAPVVRTITVAASQDRAFGASGLDTDLELTFKRSIE